ncbi:MAG: hypothetical protein K6E29_09600 [Cyanobacteria bacterium RUI128]|nr:hypothetical protein [Cyanobacteria bacterium RUI128]
MAADNSPAQGVVDAYASQVDKQKAYAARYENFVRGVLVPKDQKAEDTAERSYLDMKFATGVFDAASSDELTLQQQKEKIEQERDRKIAEIKHKIDLAIRDGNTAEVDRLNAQIPLIMKEYKPRLANLDFNIQRAGRTFLLKQDTLAEARSIYTRDRFTNISTSNDVFSGFQQAGRNWNAVGRMLQHQGFLQTQVDIREGNVAPKRFDRNV